MWEQPYSQMLNYWMKEIKNVSDAQIGSNQKNTKVKEKWDLKMTKSRWPNLYKDQTLRQIFHFRGRCNGRTGLILQWINVRSIQTSNKVFLSSIKLLPIIIPYPQSPTRRLSTKTEGLLHIKDQPNLLFKYKNNFLEKYLDYLELIKIYIF